MAQVLDILSIISFVVAGILFVIAVFLWFFFGIPSVVGDLSGRTAKKSIAKMRVANEKTGVKAYRESKANAERGKVTDTIGDNAKKGAQKASQNKTAQPKKAQPESANPETGLLSDSNPGVMYSEETAWLGAEATAMLEDDGSTALLEPYESVQVERTGGKVLQMIDFAMLIHTDEVIE